MRFLSVLVLVNAISCACVCFKYRGGEANFQFKNCNSKKIGRIADSIAPGIAILSVTIAWVMLNCTQLFQQTSITG